MGALVYDDARSSADMLRETMTEQQIKANYSVVKVAHILFAVLSFGMMFTFLMFWWQGVNLDAVFDKMGINTGTMVALGLIFSAAIATGEYAVYKDAFSDKLILLAKIGIIFLCVLSDVGVNMDREDERVRNLSADSPALTAAVSAVEKSAASNSSMALPVGYSKALTDQQSAAEWVNGKCQTTHASKGAERIQKCITAEQAKLDAATASLATLSASMGAIASAQEAAKGANQTALIGQIKDLQHDETNNAHPLVKLVTYITSMEFIFSSMMVSLMVMVPPQLLFMAIGRQLLRYEMAMGMEGSSEKSTFSNASLRVDTQKHAANTQIVGADDTQKAALATIWQAIDQGEITKISTRDEGEIHLKLKNSESWRGLTNESRRKLVYFVIDALFREKVLMKNPQWKDGQSNGNLPEFTINPDRPIRYVGKP